MVAIIRCFRVWGRSGREWQSSELTVLRGFQIILSPFRGLFYSWHAVAKGRFFSSHKNYTGQFSFFYFYELCSLSIFNLWESLFTALVLFLSVFLFVLLFVCFSFSIYYLQPPSDNALAISEVPWSNFLQKVICRRMAQVTKQRLHCYHCTANFWWCCPKLFLVIILQKWMQPQERKGHSWTLSNFCKLSNLSCAWVAAEMSEVTAGLTDLIIWNIPWDKCLFSEIPWAYKGFSVPRWVLLRTSVG